MTSANSAVPYQTRRRTKAGAARGSRVDRRRTRVGLLSYLSDSGDESDSCSSSSESDCYTEGSETDIQGITTAGNNGATQGDSEEEQGVSQSCRARRKRACSTVLVDSSSDSSSDVGGQPVRKVLPKKRLCLQLHVSDSDTEAGEKQPEKESNEAVRKKERHRKLEELVERKKSGVSRSRRRTFKDSEKEDGEEQSDRKDEVLHVKDEQDDDKEDAAVALAGSSEEDEDGGACVTVAHSSEEDSDSMRDFIVDDEEQNSGEESKALVTSLLSHHLPHMVAGSQKKHFQMVVKAFLINVLDQTFLKSLYDGIRTKRYALQMKDSLYHLDHHYVLPHLDNLKGRSRWSERYKERVDCYPNVRILKTGGRDRMCEACELHRCVRFHVRLSGQLYDFKTLQDDTFLPNDIQVFQVGNICAHRTEVYHQLKHFKYHLYCRCRKVLENEEACCGQQEEESVKEVVNRVFTKLQDQGWVTEQYKKFEEQQHAAIYFQDEKLN